MCACPGIMPWYLYLYLYYMHVHVHVSCNAVHITFGFGGILLHNPGTSYKQDHTARWIMSKMYVCLCFTVHTHTYPKLSLVQYISPVSNNQLFHYSYSALHVDLTRSHSECCTHHCTFTKNYYLNYYAYNGFNTSSCMYLLVSITPTVMWSVNGPLTTLPVL